MKLHNLKPIGHPDLPGGGQVSVKDGIAYVGHMAPPIGTSIVDVSNPKAPRILAQLEVPANIHCQKARVIDHLLVVNRHNGLDILEGRSKAVLFNNRERPKARRRVSKWNRKR